MKMDIFNRKWIIDNAIEVISTYEKGILTLRGLHYKLVARGMTNTIRHYKRVVTAMIEARRNGLVDYDVFSDRDREMSGETPYEEVDLETSIDKGKYQVEAWMENYYRNKWENQKYSPIVLIEKKALIGVFEKPCINHKVMLGACKGYPSLTFLHNISNVIKNMINENKIPVILYFGDYDPSGEDIPRSIKDNLINDFEIAEDDFILHRILLKEEQVISMSLPPAPVKSADSRTNKWEGLGQVELDAVDPKIIIKYLDNAISIYFDEDKYNDLIDLQTKERKKYIFALKEFVNNIN